MTASREIVSKTLAHTRAARIPIDFGATAVTGLHVTCVAALREHFGLPQQPVRVWEPYQMLGHLDDDLLDVLRIDTVGVVPRCTMFGFPVDDWKAFRMPWGQEVLVPGQFNVTEDAAGDLLIYPEGDTSAPPSGRMPSSAFFFDSIIRQPPIDDSQLDPADNLEEFAPISDEDLDHFDREVQRGSASGRAVVATFGGTAVGDIALVPAPFLKYPKGIRDVAEWYVSTAVRQDYLHAVFERQTEIALENLARIFSRVGNAVDVVFICGTDFGTQTSTFCSTATYSSLYMPYYKRMNDWIHTHTQWKTFKHSCGAVESFMESFIESGFDVINPVQCSAAGMDPGRLKAEYGDRLTFWGGGVDTQRTLPFGTPEEVRREVFDRCEVFGPDGGFVFNSVHNIQANTPTENIVAMFEAVHQFNGNPK
ncbi:MAG: methyltransferase [Candidatus Nealsonbacteria bacterium]|nr:methyltransferase [Candidatus Nealsonbacteria bacterium]